MTRPMLSKFLAVLFVPRQPMIAVPKRRSLPRQFKSCVICVISLTKQRKRLLRPRNPENQSRFAQAAKAVSQALNQVINCLPGQRDVDAAIKEIAAASVALTTGQYPPAGDMSFQDVQTSLSVSVNVSASELVARDAHAIGASVAEIRRKIQGHAQLGAHASGTIEGKEERD